MVAVTSAEIAIDDNDYVRVADAGEDFIMTYQCRNGILLAYAANKPSAAANIGHAFFEDHGRYDSVSKTNPCWIKARVGQGTFVKTSDTV